MSRSRFALALVLLLPTLGLGCQKRDEAIKTMQVYDLLVAFPRAVIKSPGPKYVQQGNFAVGREELPGLFIHPPSTVEFPPVRVLADSMLTFRFGVRDEAWDKPGDGVDFTVYVQGYGPRVKAFTRYADPKHEPNDRHWIDGRVPLRAFANQDIRITFATDPGPAGDTTHDWAVFAEPRIVLSTK